MFIRTVLQSILLKRHAGLANWFSCDHNKMVAGKEVVMISISASLHYFCCLPKWAIPHFDFASKANTTLTAAELDDTDELTKLKLSPSNDEKRQVKEVVVTLFFTLFIYIGGLV